MSKQPTPSISAEADAFLRAHPELLVGRDALEKAEREFGDDTFSIVNKPIANVVLIQHFNPDTLDRLFAVALIDDAKAEKYYKESNQDGKDGEEDTESCPGCGAGSSRARVGGPERFLYAKMETCKEQCPEAQVGRMWPA
ncbi:hypothetical protein E4U52_005096 [Claviceps spartinae]|nr:hypothetical protein E4U52_005096 [Claviceps spartinae]KAG6081001.1 hypothetical protein E4U15_003072 [Claviceps sp. LM218 group G6]KAG6100444.1 hypothetical protein E4U30_004603 [Claviceps sp. LM220 group G6]KAG6104688.1 hypothetical protein E4U31_001853 [Claviceps sp. LM219 group G6]KAG6119969.1 hypothetical protein E4U14_004476 [Claviceps sp. LM454 group G7]